MDDAFHAVASAMSAVQQQLETAALNAANARTPGYVNRVTTTRSFATALDGELNREASLVTATNGTAFQQGTVVRSDSEHAIALQGPGFLAVQTPFGTAYTRNGDLTLLADGTLATRAGYPVLGAAGPLRIYPGEGQARIDAETRVLLQGEQNVGELRVVEFDHPEKLERSGETLFHAPPEAGEKRAENTTIQTGMLELPPERAVAGLIGLISASRDFEAAQRVTSVINGTYQKLIGRNG